MKFKDRLNRISIIRRRNVWDKYKVGADRMDILIRMIEEWFYKGNPLYEAEKEEEKEENHSMNTSLRLKINGLIESSKNQKQF